MIRPNMSCGCSLALFPTCNLDFFRFLAKAPMTNEFDCSSVSHCTVIAVRLGRDLHTSHSAQNTITSTAHMKQLPRSLNQVKIIYPVATGLIWSGSGGIVVDFCRKSQSKYE